MITARIEDYLEEIFLIETTGREITVTDLADRLNITKGTVTAAVQKMVEAGVLRHERYGALHLTEEGRLKGLMIHRRHEGLREFFHELLGVDRERASEMACGMEHYMDSVTENRFYAVLEFFRRARANREPWVSDFFSATENRVSLPVPLSVLEAGQKGVVSHLSAEENLRGRLQKEGFVPGAPVTCLSVEPGEDSESVLQLTCGGQKRTLVRREASAIWLQSP
ncbi:MAG: metal-dependent transcriptional regulator [Synergistaceae bacterium]|jgi:DtxR family Mn-dependent transcriptional regulator|nr:metal-dependent transcriptional regulator [Synergistaceae bacterium]